MNNTIKWLIFILLIVLGCYIAYRVIRWKLKHKVDTITAFTGGLGAGKTLMSVDYSVKLYRKQVRLWKKRRRRVFIKNAFRFAHPLIFDEEKPLYFSNIPVIIGGSKNNPIYSYLLTKEHLLLQESIPNHSVIFIDEIGAFASQFDFKEKNVVEVFDEFVRFYRHYTKGGYIVCNDQCSDNINLTIRRRLNIVHNLSNCFVFWRLCFYYERMICISEEIKTIDMAHINSQDVDTQSNARLVFRFLWHKKRYDTFCYSDRYNSVPRKDYELHDDLKTHHLLRCPKDKEKVYKAKTN